jgi:hypothetical protein
LGCIESMIDSSLHRLTCALFSPSQSDEHVEASYHPFSPSSRPCRRSSSPPKTWRYPAEPAARQEPEEREHPTAFFERKEVAQLAAAILPGTGRRLRYHLSPDPDKPRLPSPHRQSCRGDNSFDATARRCAPCFEYLNQLASALLWLRLEQRCPHLVMRLPKNLSLFGHRPFPAPCWN